MFKTMWLTSISLVRCIVMYMYIYIIHFVFVFVGWTRGRDAPKEL